MQDVARLIGLHVGNQPFIAFLDKIFNGGDYELDNEPGMHLPWLYIYAGNTHHTFEVLKSLLAEKYNARKCGLPGNDAAGTTSAWYIVGNYAYLSRSRPNSYLLTRPVFSKTDFVLESGKHFEISAINLSKANTYIQSALINGKPLNGAWLTHDIIMNGGKLVLKMGNKPSAWGSNKLPPSFEAISGLIK